MNYYLYNDDNSTLEGFTSNKSTELYYYKQVDKLKRAIGWFRERKNERNTGEKQAIPVLRKIIESIAAYHAQLVPSLPIRPG